MFNTTHVLYIIISAILSVAVLVFAHFFIKNDIGKTRFLRVFAIITVFIHYSLLFVDYFSDGTATLESSMLLPIHPCNVCMWLLLATSFIKRRTSLVFRLMADFTFLAGVVCGVVGILLNENFAANPTLTDYGVLKGLLSHSTMILGCLYLCTSGIVKIRVSNLFGVVAGLVFFVVDGAVINLLFYIFGLPECNSMYLLSPPFPEYPWINTLVLGVFGLLLAFVITAIYEQLALPNGERWYNVIDKRFLKKKKENR